MKIFIGPYPDTEQFPDAEGEQEVSVQIDPWDTWSMDNTLALIVLPMLKQLKKTKHGASFVDNEDVPESLAMPEGWREEKYSVNGETDPHFFERWDYVLDEMIWAFEAINADPADEHAQFYGPLIRSEIEDGEMKLEYEWRNEEGIKAHHERMDNGFRLFGKYYRSLWD